MSRPVDPPRDPHASGIVPEGGARGTPPSWGVRDQLVLEQIVRSCA
jgi:hypothetical protein